MLFKDCLDVTTIKAAGLRPIKRVQVATAGYIMLEICWRPTRLPALRPVKCLQFAAGLRSVKNLVILPAYATAGYKVYNMLAVTYGWRSMVKLKKKWPIKQKNKKNKNYKNNKAKAKIDSRPRGIACQRAPKFGIKSRVSLHFTKNCPKASAILTCDIFWLIPAVELGISPIAVTRVDCLAERLRGSYGKFWRFWNTFSSNKLIKTGEIPWGTPIVAQPQCIQNSVTVWRTACV
jgi:hypothetical protein